MLKNPQASILISSYNKGNYLEQCIKSCLSQTQKNIEVVLLDNHSNDKTNVCLLYTSPSPRDRTRSRMPSSA